MKRRMAGFLVLAATVVFACPAWSIPLPGSVDNLIAETTLPNSGDQTEIDWVNEALSAILGYDVSVTLEEKYDVTGGQWEAVDGMAGVYAHELVDDPVYFMVKTGNVTTDSTRNFLFENLDDLSFAVIDLAEMDFVSITNVRGISHIDEFNGTSKVPEPGTLLLLGSGLCGLALMRRRRQQ